MIDKNMLLLFCGVYYIFGILTKTILILTNTTVSDLIINIDIAIHLIMFGYILYNLYILFRGKKIEK